MRRVLVVGIALLLAAFVGAQEYDTLFFDGFESGDLSAWGNGLFPVQWHITSGSHAIDGNSWWSGNEDFGGYSDYWMHLLVTPEIELPASPDGDLTLSASVDISVEGPPDSPVPWPLGEGETLWVDGWDGCQVRITTDGGETWHILEPEGGYPCHMMYGFLINEGDTSDAAGWGGTFSGDVTFDLSDYAGQTVRIAFVMASDVSWSTADDPSLYGFVVDNIEVADASTSYFLEDADDHTNPMDTLNMSFSIPQPTVTNATAFEGTYSCWAENEHNAAYELVTPIIHIPDDFIANIGFAVYRDAPDWEGPDSDEYIDDLYLIFVSTDNGLSWQRIAADWYHEGSDPEWVECNSNSDIEYYEGNGLCLSDFRGQDIKVKFLFLFDDNDDGGVGTGFYIDNVTIYGAHVFDHDVGVKEIATSPINVGETATLNFGVMGYGIATAVTRVHYAIYDSATGTEISSGDVGPATAGLFEEKFLSTTWTPDAAGTYNIVAWTTLPTDENPVNDTAMITIHLDEDVWELGYDDGVPDTYSIITTDSTGETHIYGPYTVFLSFIGLPTVQFDSPFSGARLTSLSFRGIGEGSVAFKIFEFNVDDSTISGMPLAEYEFDLPEDFPTDPDQSRWITFPVESEDTLPSQFAVLVSPANEESWIEISADRDATELRTYISEYDSTFGIYTHTHQSRYVPYIDSVGAMIRCKVSSPGGIEEKDFATLPAKVVLLTNTPNPFNPATEIKFELPASQTVRLEVVDINGKVVKTLVNGDLDAGVHSVRWDGKDTNGNDMPSGIYFYRLITEGGSVSRKMMLVR